MEKRETDFIEIPLDLIPYLVVLRDLLDSDSLISLESFRDLLFNNLINNNNNKLVCYEDNDETLSSHPPIKFDESCTLSVDQKSALNQLWIWFNENRESSYFRFMGYAGTGKSFTITYFIKWLVGIGIKPLILSPTHKAAKNLQNFLTCQSLDLEVSTLAKALGLQPKWDENRGIDKFNASQYKETLESIRIIIIDEFSMISHENLNLLLSRINKNPDFPQQIIFIGDPAQLPPVESDPKLQGKIPVMELKSQEFQLTKIMRYDGDIVKIAQTIRETTFFPKYYPLNSTPDNTIQAIDTQTWILYGTELIKANPDQAKFISYTNQACDYLNKVVWGKIWGLDWDDRGINYKIGDRLIAKKPISRLMEDKYYYQILCPNSTEFEVIGKPYTGYLEEIDFLVCYVPVKADFGLELELRILIPKERERLESLIQEKRKNQEKISQKFYKSWDYASHSYSLTCHKAQGSSIDYVFLNLPDLKGPDLQRLLYTAITRTKIKCLVLKP